jgi:hypothetical protein
MKTIDLETCMICGGEKEEHHSYEPVVLLVPDSCVCFCDDNWVDLYNEEGARYIPEVCNEFVYDSERIGCVHCCHDLACHKQDSSK